MSTVTEAVQSASQIVTDAVHTISPSVAKPKKLHGRAFYESIGSPKVILAPMVDQSEFAWRMLSRSFMPEGKAGELLAYTPMFHARLFMENQKHREMYFQPTKSILEKQWPVGEGYNGENLAPNMDGNPAIDRPLFVQFCANKPEEFLEAAKYVQPYCDAVDLNLGCPQGIAKKGHYGAFLQEDWDLIYKLINKLHLELDIPVTAKMRIQETKEKTLEYAKMILSAGASIITIHGRQRHQKGHNTGLADYSVIKYVRDNLPPETVMFANGNILQYEDIAKCLAETGVDGVMSAEGNLNDPSIFAPPPPTGQEGREYWRGKDGKGGYRMDAMLRRYMDIIYKYALNVQPPERKPLFLPSDPQSKSAFTDGESDKENEEGPPAKKQKKSAQKTTASPNLNAMQPHSFNMLRPLVSKHHDVRDALARARKGNIEAYENVLQMVEKIVKQGLVDYERGLTTGVTETPLPPPGIEDADSSYAAVERCKRPWWICQPYIRPLPKEAYLKGAMSLSKREKARLEQENEDAAKVGLTPGGTTVKEAIHENGTQEVEVPKEGLVCG